MHNILKYIKENINFNNNFKIWFNGSKIVDDKNNPLICYHGSRSDFNIFKPSKSIGNQGENDQIEGIYFTDNREAAEFFALKDDDKYIKSVYLSIKNPYIVLDHKTLKTDLGIDKLSDVNTILKDLGYDGIIMKNGFYANGGPYTLYLAFYPNQIKSIHNNGKWNINTDNINESFNEDELTLSMLPNKLYHASPISNKEDILKNGIKLGTGGQTYLNRTYSPRIYLATSLIGAYDIQLNFNSHTDLDYIIFEIDTNKLSGHFYEDSKYAHGIWTDKPISKDAIIRTIDPDTLKYTADQLDRLYNTTWFDYDEDINESKDVLKLFKNDTINDDIVIDRSFIDIDPSKITLKTVNGNVILKTENGVIPLWLKGVKIYGDFDCSKNMLKSLENCPEYIGGKFDCSNNRLYSLEGGPEYVGKSYLCTNNDLLTLKGSPKYVFGDFDCSYNTLKDLEYCPKMIRGNLICHLNMVKLNRPDDVIIKGNFFN